MFKLVNYETKVDYELEEDIILFETPQKAATAANNLFIIFNNKYVVKPFPIIDNSWMIREEEKFTNGIYKKVLPSLQKYCLPEHYVHVSMENPELIAYTKSPYKGMSDMRTKSSIRGYLETYATNPNLTSDVIDQLTVEHALEFAYSELKWATTSEEIVHVYTNYSTANQNSGVVKSCMRHSTYNIRSGSGFETDIHPVSVFEGDIKVAYFTDDQGKVVCRTLVYEKNKVYSRVYGTDTTNQVMHQMMQNLGYDKSTSYYNYKGNDVGFYADKEVHSKSFLGARLKLIKWDSKFKNDSYGSGPELFVMPYLDDFASCTLMKGETEDDYYIIIGDIYDQEGYIKSIHARNICGWSQ